MELAHNEDGRLIQTVGFPYEEIAAHEGDSLEFNEADTDLSQLSDRDMQAGLIVMDKLLKWVWQSGMRNPDGVKIRAIILCWICLKQLRSVTLTDMANGYGMDKQSIGRWVDEFKRRYPTVRIPHMK